MAHMALGPEGSRSSLFGSGTQGCYGIGIWFEV